MRVMANGLRQATVDERRPVDSLRPILRDGSAAAAAAVTERHKSVSGCAGRRWPAMTDRCVCGHGRGQLSLCQVGRWPVCLILSKKQIGRR